MDTEKVSFWVRLILTIISALLGTSGQIQLAQSLMDRHEISG